MKARYLGERGVWGGRERPPSVAVLREGTEHVRKCFPRHCACACVAVEEHREAVCTAGGSRKPFSCGGGGETQVRFPLCSMGHKAAATLSSLTRLSSEMSIAQLCVQRQRSRPPKL